MTNQLRCQTQGLESVEPFSKENKTFSEVHLFVNVQK